MDYIHLSHILHELVKEMPTGVPQGPAYAACNAKGIDLPTFTRAVNHLVRRGYVRLENHCIYPVAPDMDDDRVTL